jgi:hypothetical protein
MPTTTFNKPTVTMPADVREAFRVFHRLLTTAERNSLVMGLAANEINLVQAHTTCPTAKSPYFQLRCISADLIGYGFMRQGDPSVKAVARYRVKIRLEMGKSDDAAYDRLLFWWHTTPRGDARYLVLELMKEEHRRLRVLARRAARDAAEAMREEELEAA